MSGLLALLDDVAALAKVAAASVDDVAGQAMKTTAKVAGSVIDDAVKAGSKAAGALIDDAAVTPKYTVGFAAARELPIVGRIAAGSIKNKLLILLPAALLLSAFAPQLIAPLLMLGGGYLCFEGAEKILHAILHPKESHAVHGDESVDALSLEESRVAGAVKTDFILSAEIMTIALSAIPESTFFEEALTLAIVAVGITVLVYGSVAVIVKADDVGLHMAERGRLGLTRAIGRGIVRGMPKFMKLLTIVGTAAMLWVGGSIVIHGLEELGFGLIGHTIHDIAHAIAHALPLSVQGFAAWVVTAFLDGVFGVLLGIAIVPLVTRIINPLIALVRRDKPA
jgi:predicted DNA repair protein MutK